MQKGSIVYLLNNPLFYYLTLPGFFSKHLNLKKIGDLLHYKHEIIL